MNPQAFSIIGYVSVVLWLLMIAFWIIQEVKRPRGWFCHIALVIGLLAFVCAKINSNFHVNRLEVDRSDQIAEQQARQEAARKAAMEARGEEVAQIKFAEDSSTDFLDTAGLDDDDKQYLEQQISGEDAADDEPAWKKQKKDRSRTQVDDDSLDGLIDTTEDEGGVNTDEVEIDEQQAEPSAILPDADVTRAHLVDSWNLKIIRWMLLLGVGAVFIDYLRRVNTYEEAYLPLPVPGRLCRAIKPLEYAWPVGQARSIVEDLEWIIKRGDMFLYMSNDTDVLNDIPDEMYKFPTGKGAVDVFSPEPDDPIQNHSFIFETLWHGRASYVIDSPEQAEELLRTVVKTFKARLETRAIVSQPFHIIWDMDVPLDDDLFNELSSLAPLTGAAVIVKEG